MIKKKYITNILTLALLLALQLNVIGQIVVIPDKPLEDIFVTTDREIYVIGDIIRFSLIVNRSGSNSPTLLSKVVYAELFNQKYKPVAQGKFNVLDGNASGYLKIPEDLPTDYYFIRFYTRYMCNFHPKTVPLKCLTIINPEIPLVKSGTEDKNPLEYETFSSNLVSGMPAKIAIRVKPEELQNINSVSLHNQDSAVIPTIGLFENGLGLVEFKPEAASEYFFNIHNKSGDSMQLPVKNINQSGLFVSIERYSGKILYNLQSIPTEDNIHGTDLKFTILSPDYTIFEQKDINFVSQYEESINESSLDPGLNYFVLQDSDDKIVEFTTFFVLPDTPETLTINGLKNIYSSREEVTFDLVLPQLLKSDSAKATISVFKKGTSAVKNNLLNNALIRNPDIIINHIYDYPEISPELIQQINISTILFRPFQKKHLDLQKILQTKHVQLRFIPELRDITISGFVRDKKTGEPVVGSKVFLSFIDKYSQIHFDNTGENGEFIIPVIQQGYNKDLFICTFDRDADDEILVNSDFSTDFPLLQKANPTLDTSNKRLIEELFINKQVQEKISQSKSYAKTISEPFNLGFGSPDISIRLEDYIDLPSMEVVLNEIVPYVKVRRRKGDYRITILDSETGLSYENHLILIDNIPVNNINDLMRIHPSNVDQVDVINRTYFIGEHVFKGVLMITTNTDNFGGVSLPPNAIFLEYSLTRQDSAFQNINPHIGENAFKQPDFRTLLFWDSNIDLHAGNTFSFFTSDHHSDYILFVRGFTKNGTMFSGSVLFRVE